MRKLFEVFFETVIFAGLDNFFDASAYTLPLTAGAIARIIVRTTAIVTPLRADDCLLVIICPPLI